MKILNYPSDKAENFNKIIVCDLESPLAPNSLWQSQIHITHIHWRLLCAQRIVNKYFIRCVRMFQHKTNVCSKLSHLAYSILPQPLSSNVARSVISKYVRFKFSHLFLFRIRGFIQGREEKKIGVRF